MSKSKKYFFIVNMNTITKTLLLITLTYVKSISQGHLKLWYTEPAEVFEEAILIGNGKQGATIFGGVNKEKILLNDITLWTGQPASKNDIETDAQKRKLISDALTSKNFNLADSLINLRNTDLPASYCPLGSIDINFKKENHQNYYRELSLSDAVAKVLYDTKDNSYYREYFFSYPDNALVIKLNAKNAKSLNFSLIFHSVLNHNTETKGPILYIEGRAPYALEVLNEENEPVISKYSDQKGTRFSARVLIEQKGGILSKTDSTILVENANEAIIKISMSTSFNGFENDPEKDGKNNKAIADKRIRDIISSDFYLLKMRHVKDYNKYFSRITLNLGEDSLSTIPTKVRLMAYSKFKGDPFFEALFFQYARYLFISSSRTPNVPVNALGLWSSNSKIKDWKNYKMDIGIEENYWLAESTNLTEMHFPFLTFIENLEKKGIVEARSLNDSPGWISYSNSDIWARTSSKNNFNKTYKIFENWNWGAPIGVAHLWKHYTYTQDKEYLKTKAYPIMKSAAEYCLFNYKNYENENIGSISIILELYKEILMAADVLKIQDEFTNKVSIEVARLLTIQSKIIQSFTKNEKPENSLEKPVQLYGLYPGNQFDFQETPILLDKLKHKLEFYNYEKALAWNMNLYARLGDGNKAYELLQNQLKYTQSNTFGNKSHIGTYSNLLTQNEENETVCNFGFASGISEMLLQSSLGKIIVLPALPDAWKTGNVKGLKASGGFEVDISWENGKLIDLTIKSDKGGETKMYYRGNVKQIKLKAGKKINFKSI